MAWLEIETFELSVKHLKYLYRISGKKREPLWVIWLRGLPHEPIWFYT
jgi:hypothetical protein